MLAMIVNNVIWVRRQSFSAGRHTIHYLLAALVILLYLPRRAWWPAMTDVKFMYTAMNIFIFQMLLGHIASLTALHQMLTIMITMIQIVLTTMNWFDV